MQTLILKGLRMEQCRPGCSHKETSQGKAKEARTVRTRREDGGGLATACRSPSTHVARRETGRTSDRA